MGGAGLDGLWEGSLALKILVVSVLSCVVDEGMGEEEEGGEVEVEVEEMEGVEAGMEAISVFCR